MSEARKGAVSGIQENPAWWSEGPKPRSTKQWHCIKSSWWVDLCKKALHWVSSPTAQNHRPTSTPYHMGWHIQHGCDSVPVPGKGQVCIKKLFGASKPDMKGCGTTAWRKKRLSQTWGRGTGWISHPGSEIHLCSGTQHIYQAELKYSDKNKNCQYLAALPLPV